MSNFFQPLGEAELRRALVSAGLRLRQAGLVVAKEGNLSVRLDAARLLVTPSGCDKGRLTAQDLLCVDFQGRRLSGRGEPTSELALHLEAYRRRPDARAVVHAHPPTATGFAAAGLSLEQPVLPEAVLFLGPVPLSPYAPTGTRAMAEALSEYLARHHAVLLANHGAVALGSSLEEALDRMETLEQLARVTLTARLLGGERLLEAGETARLRARAGS